jgi:hypothetical protein
LLLAATTFLPEGDPLIKDSRLAPHVTVITTEMARVIPREMKQVFSKKMKEFQDTWKRHR